MGWHVVDPSSLDMMNQQEHPASNVGAQMFESLLERVARVPINQLVMHKLQINSTMAAQGRVDLLSSTIAGRRIDSPRMIRSICTPACEA